MRNPVKYVSFVFISLTFMSFLCCCHVIGQNDNNTSSSMSSATRSIIETNKIEPLPDYSLQENQKEQLNKHLISEEDLLNDANIWGFQRVNGNWRFGEEGVFYDNAIYVFCNLYFKDKFDDLSDKKLLSNYNYELFSVKNSKDNDEIFGNAFDPIYYIYKKYLSTKFLLNGVEYEIGSGIHVSNLDNYYEGVYICETLYMEAQELIEKIDKVIGETDSGALIYSVVGYKETDLILVHRSPCAWLAISNDRELICNSRI